MSAKTTKYTRRKKREAAMGKHSDGFEGMRSLDYCRPFSADADGGKVVIDAYMLQMYSALESIAKGPAPTDVDVGILAHAVKVSAVRAEEISATLIPPLQAAADSLSRCWRRGLDGKAYRFDGPGYEAVHYALDIYREILTHSSAKQMSDATDKVAKLEGKK